MATTYPHISLPYVHQILPMSCPWKMREKVADYITTFKPDHILIIFHGLMSYQAAFYCASKKIPFTIFYGWRAPEVIHAQNGIPHCMLRLFINKFLSKASTFLYPVLLCKTNLSKKTLKILVCGPHGVNLDTFTLTTAESKQAARKSVNRKLPYSFLLICRQSLSLKKIYLHF